MKHRLTTWWCGLLTILATPVLAFAEDEMPAFNARLNGYKVPVTPDGGSSAINWLLVLFLTLVTLAVLFKNAKRTHLD
jgi:hypothetical protein